MTILDKIIEVKKQEVQKLKTQTFKPYQGKKLNRLKII